MAFIATRYARLSTSIIYNSRNYMAFIADGAFAQEVESTIVEIIWLL